MAHPHYPKQASGSNPSAGYEHLPPGASAASAENSQMRVNTTMNNSYPVTEALPIHAPDQKIKRWIALTVLMLPVLLVSVDNTVLAFAVPSIAQALEPSSSEQLWIVDAYSLRARRVTRAYGKPGRSHRAA